MAKQQVHDIAIASTCLLLVILYHVRLAILIRKYPETTVIGLTRFARSAWVHHLMSTKKLDVYPVQALRNLTMAASILATAALTIFFGIIVFLAQYSTKTAFPTTAEESAKVTIILVCVVVSFFGFMQSMRYYNHTIFVISSQCWTPDIIRSAKLGGPQIARTITPKSVSRILNRGGMFFTLGMRGFYLAFPVVLWLFGSYHLIIGTVALLVVLYIIDTAFESYERDDDGNDIELGASGPVRVGSSEGLTSSLA